MRDVVVLKREVAFVTENRRHVLRFKRSRSHRVVLLQVLNGTNAHFAVALGGEHIAVLDLKKGGDLKEASATAVTLHVQALQVVALPCVLSAGQQGATDCAMSPEIVSPVASSPVGPDTVMVELLR